jgi:hypothetical protein
MGNVTTLDSAVLFAENSSRLWPLQLLLKWDSEDNKHLMY